MESNTQIEKTKAPWGGKRDGAGRKKTSQLTHPISLKISENAWQLLQRTEHKAAAIDAAIRSYLDN